MAEEIEILGRGVDREIRYVAWQEIEKEYQLWSGSSISRMCQRARKGGPGSLWGESS